MSSAITIQATNHSKNHLKGGWVVWWGLAKKQAVVVLEKNKSYSGHRLFGRRQKCRRFCHSRWLRLLIYIQNPDAFPKAHGKSAHQRCGHFFTQFAVYKWRLVVVVFFYWSFFFLILAVSVYVCIRSYKNVAPFRAPFRGCIWWLPACSNTWKFHSFHPWRVEVLSGWGFCLQSGHQFLFGQKSSWQASCRRVEKCHGLILFETSIEKQQKTCLEKIMFMIIMSKLIN